MSPADGMAPYGRPYQVEVVMDRLRRFYSSPEVCRFTYHRGAGEESRSVRRQAARSRADHRAIVIARRRLP